METLTIHPADNDQDTAIRMFLDALHVNYNANNNQDETEYLLSSEAMAKHLDEAMEQKKNGEGVKVNLDDLWK